MPTLIDPTQIPGQDLEPDDIDAAARTIRAVGVSFAKQGKEVRTTWQRLATSYEAPEDETLFAVMDPVQGHAETIGSDLKAVSTALVRFADDVRPIKASLTSIRQEAWGFWVSTRRTFSDRPRPEVLGVPLTGTPPWHEDPVAVATNNALVAQVNDQVELLWAAERRCANAIYALSGHRNLVAGDAPGAASATSYGLDDIPRGTPLGWGSEGSKTLTPREAIDAAAARSVTDPFVDVAAHLGFDLSVSDHRANVDWSLHTAVGAANDDIRAAVQLGTTMFALSAAGQNEAARDTPFGRHLQQQRHAAKVAAQSAVDGVQADPWGTATTAAITITSLLIPVVGEAKAAEFVSRTARTTGRALATASDAARLALKESRAAGLSKHALRSGLRTLEMSPSDMRAAVRQLRESLGAPHALAVHDPKDLTLHMEDGSDGRGPHHRSNAGRHGIEVPSDKEIESRGQNARLMEALQPRRERFSRVGDEYRTVDAEVAGTEVREKGRRVSQSERDAAAIWTKRGYNVLHLRDGLVEKQRTPDLLIEGIGDSDTWSPLVIDDTRKVKKGICSKGDQSSFIQVEVQECRLSVEQLNEAVERTFGSTDGRNIDHVMFSHKGQVILDRFRDPDMDRLINDR